LRILWTFESQAKLEKFIAILKANDIPFEIMSKGRGKSESEIALLVDEHDYEMAKKLLVTYRKRKSSK
jgi:hypothetical protein